MTAARPTHAVLLAMIGLIAAVTLAGFAARFGYPWELASHFRPQLATAAALTAVIGLVGRRLEWRAIAGASVLALTNAVATAAPLRLAAPGLAAPSQDEAALTRAADTDASAVAGRLRVIWAHVDADEVALGAVAGLARREAPDIVALTALPDDAPLAAVFPEFSCVVRPTEPSRYAVVVLSRGVCAPLKPPVGGPWPFAAQRARARAPVTVVAAHAPRPLDWRAVTSALDGWRDAGRIQLRDEVIEAAGAAVWGDPPALLVGDFNAAPWSPASIDLTRRALKRVDCGAPWRSTWLTRAPLLGLPIDQAFVTAGVAADCRVGPAIVARHRPLIVDVGLMAARDGQADG